VWPPAILPATLFSENVVFRNGVSRCQKGAIVTSFNEYAKKRLLKYLKTIFFVPVK
jgi:hypothetical protein